MQLLIARFRTCICKTLAYTFGYIPPARCTVFHYPSLTFVNGLLRGCQPQRCWWLIRLAQSSCWYYHCWWHASAAQCQPAALATTGQRLHSSRRPLPPPTFSPRVQQLLAQMTLEEKIGQMTQLNISAINTTGVQKDVELDSAKAAALVRDFHIGSFLNGEAVPAAQWVRYSAALQRIALRESRLHIPMIYGIDHMHGASYVSGTAIFPHNMNLGATSTRSWPARRPAPRYWNRPTWATTGYLPRCWTWA